MNFKIDENLPVEFVDVLSTAGHSSETVAQENLSGADDTAIAAICQKEDRLLLTLDLDFSDIRSYRRMLFQALSFSALADKTNSI